MKSLTSDSLATRAHHWLSTFAIPTWLERGFDRRIGFFHEGLNSDLTAIAGPVRTLVQARQIYSFRVALDLDLCPMETAARAINAGVRFLLDQCRNADGSFAFSVHPGLGIAEARPELYTQAFALFGLGNAFALAPMPEYRRRALEVLDYLNAKRATKRGGYTEAFADGAPRYQSNPIMHLYEAAIFWMEVDRHEKRWAELAHALTEFALNHLIDGDTGLIAEEYTADWTPVREDQRFYWEPGHQFEWAWLFGRYQKFAGRDLTTTRDALYVLATTHGVRDGRVIDQAWSDLTHRARSARFWPQAERAKAAVQIGDLPAAEEAIGALTSYLDVPRPGLWCDTINEGGQKDDRPSKASSLYHIIGALAEFLTGAPVTAQPAANGDA